MSSITSSLLSSLGSSSQSLAAMQKAMFSKTDTNGDGTVSKDEFVSSRPQDVSASDASALYDKIDTTGSNALTQDQLRRRDESQQAQSKRQRQ